MLCDMRRRCWRPTSRSVTTSASGSYHVLCCSTPGRGSTTTTTITRRRYVLLSVSLSHIRTRSLCLPYPDLVARYWSDLIVSTFTANHVRLRFLKLLKANVPILVLFTCKAILGASQPDHYIETYLVNSVHNYWGKRIQIWIVALFLLYCPFFHSLPITRTHGWFKGIFYFIRCSTYLSLFELIVCSFFNSR